MSAFLFAQNAPPAPVPTSAVLVVTAIAILTLIGFIFLAKRFNRWIQGKVTGRR